MSFDMALASADATADLVVRDPSVLRALAHPRRLELLRLLRSDGPATATILGDRTHQSPASASYHLRQLAAHGLVEELLEQGRGRERWWRALHTSTRIRSEVLDSPDSRTAAVAAAVATLQDANNVAFAFLEAVETNGVDDRWVDAARIEESAIHVTLDELRSIGTQMAELLAPYIRGKKSERPADARACHVTLRLMPAVEA